MSALRILGGQAYAVTTGKTRLLASSHHSALAARLHNAAFATLAGAR